MCQYSAEEGAANDWHLQHLASLSLSGAALRTCSAPLRPAISGRCWPSRGGNVAPLGASPGASTAAFIALGVLEKCFAGELTEGGRLSKFREIVPTYGIDLAQDAHACRRTRADTAAVLKIENV
jgi:hypothetical protein